MRLLPVIVRDSRGRASRSVADRPTDGRASKAMTSSKRTSPGRNVGSVRWFALAGVVAWASILALPSVTSAQSRDPVFQFLGGGSSTEWSDGFDSGSHGADDVRTSTPILSAQIISAVQVAIAQYSEIVSRGGWPVVPTTKVLRLGVRDPAVVALRQRLAISGDIDRSVGLSDTFDSYVDAAVRRFQARHGIPVDGGSRPIDVERH